MAAKDVIHDAVKNEPAFDAIFSIEGIEIAFEQNKMPLIIVQTETEEVVKWIN